MTRILVTGAASGIGRAIAARIAADGGHGVLIDRDANLPPGEHHVGDVADAGFWDALDPGRLDGAVVNAGVAGASPIVDTDFAEWRRILSVNLDGAFLTLRASLRAMRDGGAIVVVASATGLRAQEGTAAYGTAKAGLIHLARVAAKEAAPRGIRVNIVAPGGVETPVWDAVPAFAARVAKVGRDAAFAEVARATTPLGRFARADEVAAQVAFLLSDAAATMTGATLVADGGWSL